MNIKNIFKRLLLEPKTVPLAIYANISKLTLIHLVPDSLQLQIWYFLTFGKSLNISNPLTFNEKLQWLKLNDRNPSYTRLVDKYEVRDFIRHTIGDEFLVPFIGVYNNVDKINFADLPKQFVLKCTHDSGSTVVCKNLNQLDIYSTKKFLQEKLKRSIFWSTREWPYKNIKPKIICEELLVDESGIELKDYKVFCFHGEPKIIQIMSNRNGAFYNINHFDSDWNEINIERKAHPPSLNIEKPKDWKKMLELSRTLSSGIPFVRVDFYQTENQLYFGEMTFYPASGYLDFVNYEDDLLFGSWLDLSKVTVRK